MVRMEKSKGDTMSRIATMSRVLLIICLSFLGLVGCAKKEEPKTQNVVAKDFSSEKGISKDAYIYGFPILDNYRLLYAYFVNKEDPNYKR